MGFEAGRRSGRYWDNCKRTDKLIQHFPFHTTGKNESDFESGFASSLIAMRNSFNSKIIC